MGELRTAMTEDLEVAYYHNGPAGGPVAVLLHGFPYDVLSYEAVVRLLACRGIRTITPYLRGYGPTRFRQATTLRSGQQAAVGSPE